MLFIGGHPKGYDEPFHPSTLSGNRLRTLVDKLDINAIYMDLWSNEQEEKKGIIDKADLELIHNAIETGFICIALGRWVHKKLSVQGVAIKYLPHPASRRKIDKEKLEAGLRSLSIKRGKEAEG